MAALWLLHFYKQRSNPGTRKLLQQQIGFVAGRRSWGELAPSSALQNGAEGNIKADVWLFIIYEEKTLSLTPLGQLCKQLCNHKTGFEGLSHKDTRKKKILEVS